jgi:hypothetical protein
MNAKFTEQNAIIAVISPQLVDGAAVSTTGIRFIDIQANRMVFIITVGSTEAAVDAKLVQSAAANLSTPSDITGYAITTTAATDDDTVYTIEISEKDLPLLSTKPYVGLTVTVASTSTGGYVSAIGLSVNTKHAPASAFNLAAVNEQV